MVSVSEFQALINGSKCYYYLCKNWIILETETLCTRCCHDSRAGSYTTYSWQTEFKFSSCTPFQLKASSFNHFRIEKPPNNHFVKEA